MRIFAYGLLTGFLLFHVEQDSIQPEPVEFCLKIVSQKQFDIGVCEGEDSELPWVAVISRLGAPYGLVFGLTREEAHMQLRWYQTLLEDRFNVEIDPYSVSGPYRLASVDLTEEGGIWLTLFQSLGERELDFQLVALSTGLDEELTSTAWRGTITASSLRLQVYEIALGLRRPDEYFIAEFIQLLNQAETMNLLLEAR